MCPTASTPTFAARWPQRKEKIVFTWQVWPDKESLDAAEARMHEDNALDVAGEIPFDAGRMILGCFAPISVMGRG